MDIALQQFDDGTFDIDIVGGDLQSDKGMRTAVIRSLFTDRIADDDDVIPDGSTNLRGFWADSIEGVKSGSRLWLLDREKQTDDALQRAETYASEALQWLIDDGVAASVDVSAEWTARGFLRVNITITRSDNTPYQDVFDFSLEPL